MTDHTPTPRTDAAIVSVAVSCDGDPSHRVTADFARILERELDEAHIRIAHYKRLEAILESREDVRDGPDGEQLPNEAMSILTEWRGPV